MIEKRSLSLAGHRTSVALEPEFWEAVERLASADGLAVAAWIMRVDRLRGERNLASAIRVAVLSALQRVQAVEAD